MIWKKSVSLEEINSNSPGNMLEALQIRFTAIGDDYLEATMPVNEKTKQPFGLLHGGASCVLAESLGSVASNLVVGYGEKICVGIEINANHLKAAKNGLVTGRATAVHLGNSLHVWDIQIRNEQGQKICVSRLTVMVRQQREARSTPLS
jgi:1,4-dihydroxy-2-naphthoyl-CoA hydrolase